MGGSLASASNKSSALMSRIGKAKREAGISGKGGAMMAQTQGMHGMGGMHGGMGAKRGEKGGSNIQKFIDENGIDDRAARELLKEPPAIQEAVINGGPLTGAKNPSSAVVGRIRNAKR